MGRLRRLGSGWRAPALRLLWLCASLALDSVAHADTFTVYAAASLTEVLDEIVAAWAKPAGHTVKLSFAASSTLAMQIEAGAPAALLVTADERSMDTLAEHDRLVPESRVDLLGNTLVLVMPAASVRPVALVPGFDLHALLGDGRLATGDPAYVPAGRYAEQALTHLGVWAEAEPRLVRAESVRAALVLVGRGEVPAGVVYATDAAITREVAVAGTFPPESHAPIVYPMALVREFATPAARALHAYLQGPAAMTVFARYGFKPLPH